MNKIEFERLKIGDIVQHVCDDKSYVVTGNYGGRVTAVGSVDMTNPDEWRLLGDNYKSHKDWLGALNLERIFNSLLFKHINEYKDKTGKLPKNIYIGKAQALIFKSLNTVTTSMGMRLIPVNEDDHISFGGFQKIL